MSRTIRPRPYKVFCLGFKSRSLAAATAYEAAALFAKMVMQTPPLHRCLQCCRQGRRTMLYMVRDHAGVLHDLLVYRLYPPDRKIDGAKPSRV